VIAGQTANRWVLEQSLIGATINGELKADVAAVAPYFEADIDALYKEHLGGTVNLDRVFADIDGRIDALAQLITTNHSLAQSRGLPLVAYEGGQHLVARPGEQHNNAGFVELLAKINRDPRMGAAYKRLLDRWFAAGGKTFTFFSSAGAWGKYGQWGLQEDYLDDDSVKFNAVQEYLKR
jgi:hypothetical protein